MAHEYSMQGYLSVKIDVFSYGVLILEIISGRKNHDRQPDVEKTDLLTYVSNWYLKSYCSICDL